VTLNEWKSVLKASDIVSKTSMQSMAQDNGFKEVKGCKIIALRILHRKPRNL
jgi:hypothetical protein